MAVVSGAVQGVGFRWWVSRRCEELGVTGAGENRSDGTVLVTATGVPDALSRLLTDLREGTAGRPGSVEAVRATWDDEAP